MMWENFINFINLIVLVFILGFLMFGFVFYFNLGLLVWGILTIGKYFFNFVKSQFSIPINCSTYEANTN